MHNQGTVKAHIFTMSIGRAGIELQAAFSCKSGIIPLKQKFSYILLQDNLFSRCALM